jgi:uncharacterized protein YjbI with pentapeptide repeats
MNRKIFLIVIAMMAGFAGPITPAAPPSTNLQTLQNTNKCVGYNLSGVNLRSADLASANISRAVFNDAKSVLESIVGP